MVSLGLHLHPKIHEKHIVIEPVSTSLSTHIAFLAWLRRPIPSLSPLAFERCESKWVFKLIVL
jgi:hypothetical protein